MQINIPDGSKTSAIYFQRPIDVQNPDPWVIFGEIEDNSWNSFHLSQKFIETESNDSEFIFVENAFRSDKVNGIYKRIENLNGKIAFKHVSESVFLYSDARPCCNGNWHFNSLDTGGEVFYWAYRTSHTPAGQQFYKASTNPPEKSSLKITPGKFVFSIKDWLNNS